MRQAFVLQLGGETKVAQRHFVGSVEEVDTGRELRFKSTDELLEFLANCFVSGEQQNCKSEELQE
jgi:hypothetical protein